MALTREEIKAAADASWGFGPTVDTAKEVSPLEHIPGVPQVGEVWGDPRKPETWRYILSAGPEWMSWRTFGGEVWASEPRQGFDEWFKEVKAFNIRGVVDDYLQRGDNRGIHWWMQVAEAKQEERDKARLVLTRIVAAAMTGERRNTAEWMAYMATRLNEAMELLGQKNRVRYDGETLFEVVMPEATT